MLDLSSAALEGELAFAETTMNAKRYNAVLAEQARRAEEAAGTSTKFFTAINAYIQLGTKFLRALQRMAGRRPE